VSACSIPDTLPVASPGLRLGFITLAVGIAALFTAAVHWAARRAGRDPRTARRDAGIAALLAAVWLVATASAAASGTLHFEAPPTMLIIFPLMLVLVVIVARSGAGTRIALELPLAALVGFQGFRVLVELLMHRAYLEGLMPAQMSYSGRNFDIVTGVTALLLAAWLATGRRSPRLVFAWNTLGVLLLANIVGIALLSAPTPLRVFMNEPADVWITRAPWIWLPTVMVVAAALGHVLVYRRLSRDAKS
jgi:hypothetical protein